MSVVKKFWEANNFPFSMFWGYKKASTKSEKIIDIGIPLFLAILICRYLYFLDLNLDTLVSNLLSVNNTALTFLSILAGFSIASISVLATSDAEALTTLKTEESLKLPGKMKFELMMIFFCASIVLQFFSIFLSLLTIIILPVIEITGSVMEHWWILVILGIWYFILMFTISISLRNVKVLFYVLVSKKG